jgi:phage baseplate assembly protein W
MIPTISILTEEITEQTYPSNTHKIVFSESENKDRIIGYVDGLEAIAQAVYLILSTERYQHIIYSWDYGVELMDLIGKPMPYVMSELPRRIKEALTQDNRISDVVDFEFERTGKKLHTKFTVVSNVGNLSTELEVEV